MSIKTPQELARLRAAGKVVRLMLEAMKSAVRSGVTTGELDTIGAELMRANDARSAPSLVYGFPGVSCISVNDEVVHGIPGQRHLCNGDLLKLDVTIEKDSFMADAAETVVVGEVGGIGQRLADCVRQAFDTAMTVARAGNQIMEIGRVVESEVRRRGFFVIRELGGHGIGTTIHEAPHVPNFADPSARSTLTEGLVITVEPIIASRSGRARLAADGWTMCTVDRGLAAHYEHTIVVTNGAPLILTAA